MLTTAKVRLRELLTSKGHHQPTNMKLWHHHLNNHLRKEMRLPNTSQHSMQQDPAHLRQHPKPRAALHPLLQRRNSEERATTVARHHRLLHHPTLKATNCRLVHMEVSLLQGLQEPNPWASRFLAWAEARRHSSQVGCKVASNTHKCKLIPMLCKVRDKCQCNTHKCRAQLVACSHTWVCLQAWRRDCLQAA